MHAVLRVPTLARPTLLQEFVQSALDGFRVCLFSYGQTGSGKTFTMQGYGRDVQRGIIPRAVEQVLGQTEVGWGAGGAGLRRNGGEV